MKPKATTSAISQGSLFVWFILVLVVGLIVWLIFESISLVLDLGYRNQLNQLLSVLAVCVVLAVAIAPWLQFLWRRPVKSTRAKLQFSIRTLLWSTAILAAFLAGLDVSNTVNDRYELERTRTEVTFLKAQLRDIDAELAAEATARLQAEQKLESIRKAEIGNP